MVLLPPCLVLGLLVHFSRPWIADVQDNGNGPGLTFTLFADDQQAASVLQNVTFHYSVYDPSNTTVPVTEIISKAQQEGATLWKYTNVEMPSITTHCIFYWATMKFLDFMDFTPSTTVGPCDPFHDIFSWEFEYGAVSLDTLIIFATIENATNASLAITMKLRNIHPPYNVMETFKIIFAGQSHDQMRMILCTDVCSQTSSTAVQLNQTSQNVFTMVYDENSDDGVDIDVNGVVKRWFAMDNQLVIGKLELAGFQVHRVNFTQHEYVFLIIIGHLYFGNDKMWVSPSGEVMNMPAASQLILKANEMLCQPAMPNVCAQRSENATMVFSINSKDHFLFYNGHLYHKESNSCYNLETFGTCTGIAKVSVENYYHYPIGMESGFFRDTQFHASSTIGPGFEGSKCRLNNVLGHWTPAINTTDSYLLLDFEKIININSISIQGSAPLVNFTPSWVRTLDIDIRIHLEPWIKVHQNLQANVDANTTAHIILYVPLSCSAFKLIPVTWRNRIAMRLELYTGLLSVSAVLVEVLNQPRTVKITLPSPSGHVSCSVLKPGDGSAYILGPSFCPSIFSLPNINSSLIYNDNVHINHTYPGYGIYKLYFTVKTTVFHKEQYQMVTVKACPMAEAYVGSDMIRMYVSEDLLLSVGVENVCDEITSREYQWSVFNETNVQSSGHIVSTWADAYFPTRYFKPGNYSVRVLFGSEEILGVSTEVLLQVQSSPLVMSIYGGEIRTIGNELDAVVDGKSQSYDPDIKVKSSQDMTFSWECWVLHPANQSMASELLCGGHVIPEGDFILPRDVLQADSLLLVTGTGSKDERISNASQYLHVVNGQPADIFIRCKDNCWEYSRTSLEVKLQMECGNCRSDVVTEYTWKLLEGDNEEKTLSQNTLTGINSEGLVILPEFLQQNKTYVVVGSATIAGQPKATAQYSLQLSVSPFGGTCHSDPISGTAGLTKFTFLCVGWIYNATSADGDTDKRMFIIRAKTQDTEYMFSNRNSHVTSDIILPTGDPANNHTLVLHIDICNSFYECTQVDVQVQIFPPPASLSIFEDITSPNGTLQTMMDTNPVIARGNIQVYTSLLSGLNEINTNSSMSILIDAQRKLSDNLFTVQDCEQQSLTLLNLMEASPAWIHNLDLVISSMQKLIDAMHSFHEKISIPMSLSKAMNTIADHVITSMLEADSINNDEMQKVVHHVIKMIQTNGALVLKKLVPGEPPFVHETGNLWMSCNVVNVENLLSKKWNSGSSVNSFEENPQRPLNRTDFTGVEIFRFRQNPIFVENASSTASPLVVLQLDCTDAGAAAILASKFNILVPERSKRSFKQGIPVMHNCSKPLCQALIKVRVNSDPMTMLLDLALKTNLPWIELYIRRGSIPMISQSLYECALSFNVSVGMKPQNCSFQNNLKQTRNFPLILSNLTSGMYYMLLKYPGSSSEDHSTVFITMIQYKIKSFGEEWSNDLGQVLPGSTKNNISCLFNKNDVGHLPTMDKPYFVVRDFFIPPNSIDFSTVFEKFDLKNNGAVFGTIIGILLLIFLVGLWARKADQVNKKQWKVLPVKGSDMSNQYRYIIAICTGGMPNAGTKSNIFCRISFTQTSSGTFELDNGFCKGFQRGSVRAFILPMNSCPGNPQSLRIWNDSSGEGHDRSWFLSEVLLHDAQTEQIFHFIFNVWLGYEHERTSALAKPADETMLCDKKRQFSVETKNNFSDAHIWSSIFLQYARNPFTSLQRLACCFLLLFLMMITNAMWFETAKPETLKIGPFTPGDIFIIIVSSLMEIPVSLLVVQIFRRRRAKHHSLEFSSGYLPYWTIYIAWTIVILTIITSGFFVILYSMEWGPEKANRWLLRFFSSFVISLFLIQPIKVLMLSTLKLIKNDTNSGHDLMKSMKEDLHKNLENDTGETTHETKMPAFKDAIIPTIPPEELEQRITREKHERNLRHDLAFCAIFVTLLLLMCYGQVESNSFLVHKVMKKNFIAAFKKVNNTQSYWSWIEKTVLPNFFPENHNESYAQISSKMPLMKDLHSHRIGTIRIMQIRKSPVQLSCKNAVIEKGCIQEMLKWQQDTNKYSEGWTRYKSSSNSFGYEAWQPWPVEQTSINPFFVIENVNYGSGAYTAHLGNNRTHVQRMVKRLNETGWLDSHTAVIVTEVNIYNPNVNLHSRISTFADISTGYMTLSYKIHVFRLYELDYAAYLVTNVAYGAFILLLLYMVVSMATKAARSRSKYLCHVSTWAELVLFSLGLGTISIFYLKNTSGKRSLSTIRNSPWTSELLNFIILSRQCTDFNAILVFLTSFKIFGLLGMTHWLRPMVKSVVLCGEIMRSFSFIFLFVLVGYSLLFWGIFGYWFQRYNTLSNSLTSTMAALLGKSDFRDLYSHGGSMAASLYLIFMFSFAILLFDLGILLVSEATSKAFKEDCDPSDAPRLMGNRFQTLFDMLRGSNKRSNKS